MKRLSEDKIQLCGRKNSCCPIITKLDDGNYEVLDDYGNTIKVKKENNWEEMKVIADIDQNRNLLTWLNLWSATPNNDYAS